MRQRSGMAIVIVITIILLLSVFGIVLSLLTQGAYRELDVVSGHLRAIAVGEAGYASVIARLNSTPWHSRWFRDGPDVVTGVQVPEGGSYGYMIRDTPRAAQTVSPLAQSSLGIAHQADLLIRATHDRSAVSMYWRLIIPQSSVDSMIRVIPVLFTFVPDETQLTTGDLDPITDQVNQALDARNRHTPEYASLRGPLASASSPQEINSILGFDPGRPVVDSMVPVGGSAPVPSITYMPQARSQQAALPAVPPPPPPPPGIGAGAGGPNALAGSTMGQLYPLYQKLVCQLEKRIQQDNQDVKSGLFGLIGGLIIGGADKSAKDKLERAFAGYTPAMADQPATQAQIDAINGGQKQVNDSAANFFRSFLGSGARPGSCP